jgi:hypothetical protein
VQPMRATAARQRSAADFMMFDLTRGVDLSCTSTTPHTVL